MLSHYRRDAQKGDTIIEVLLAVTVFSLIVVSALVLMNQGIATSQRALEISLARQQVDGQAETLRFLHGSYVKAYQAGSTTYDDAAGEYARIVALSKASRDGGVTSVSEFGTVPCNAPPVNSFVLNTRQGVLIDTSTIFQAPQSSPMLLYADDGTATASQGVWIEALRSTESNPDAAQLRIGYIDFHIRACWDAPGLSEPFNVGTIVRLYEPRG